MRGSSALLSRMQSGEIVAVLDLAGARAGSRLFHILSDQVRAPATREQGTRVYRD